MLCYRGLHALILLPPPTCSDCHPHRHLNGQWCCATEDCMHSNCSHLPRAVTIILVGSEMGSGAVVLCHKILHVLLLFLRSLAQQQVACQHCLGNNVSVNKSGHDFQPSCWSVALSQPQNVFISLNVREVFHCVCVCVCACVCVCVYVLC